MVHYRVSQKEDLLSALKVKKMTNEYSIRGTDTGTLASMCDDVLPATPVCDRAARYRTPDGTCNNLDDPFWGAALQPQVRIVEPAYQDGTLFNV